MQNSQITIVAIDDQPVNLKYVKALASQMGFKVVDFLDPLDAINYIYNHSVDMVLTDYMMPTINGIEVIKHIRHSHTDIPVVMITAVNDDAKVKLDALQAGATEFLNKPLNPHEFQARLTSLAKLRKAHVLLNDKARLLQHTVEQATSVIKDREHEALQLLANAAEYRDKDTSKHILRVANYSKIIAQSMGEDESFQDLIFYGAPLHDVGKLGVSDEVLKKPGKLTDDEFDEIRKHSEIGYQMLKRAQSPYVAMGAEIARTHHEAYDGSGYPKGLAGKSIPLAGRIVCLADVFDALSSKRPYKDPWSIDKAFAAIRQDSGSKFDPQVTEAFFTSKTKILEIYNQYKH